MGFCTWGRRWWWGRGRWQGEGAGGLGLVEADSALGEAAHIPRSLGAASRAEMTARRLGLNANSATTKQLLSNLDTPVADFIGRFRLGSIKGRLLHLPRIDGHPVNPTALRQVLGGWGGPPWSPAHALGSRRDWVLGLAHAVASSCSS